MTFGKALRSKIHWFDHIQCYDNIQMKCSVSSTHYHPMLSLTPFQLTEKVPTFYKFKLWLVKTDINDPSPNFILLLAMENKHYFEKKWDHWNGREEIVAMEKFSSIWFSGKTGHCTWDQ